MIFGIKKKDVGIKPPISSLVLEWIISHLDGPKLPSENTEMLHLHLGQMRSKK